MATLLSMEGITKSFFGVSVLKGVDFDLDHGEVHVLLGENGAGKSTLMKILSGAYRLDSGAIVLDGQPIDMADFTPKPAEDLGIVTVYQNFHLIPHLSVAENLAMTRFTHGRGLIRWKDVYAHAAAVLEQDRLCHRPQGQGARPAGLAEADARDRRRDLQERQSPDHG